jgi:SNF2 family DNA or RNA helicase
VVAPKRVAENVWPTEARTWRPDLSIAVAKGRPVDRARELSAGKDITVIGRDNLADALKAPQFKTVILDELSGFKNRGSQRWKAANKLTAKSTYVWGLTGTPSPNGLLDLWAQLFLLDRGARLEHTLTSFRSRYFTPGRQLANGVITEWNLRPGADKKIHCRIDDICLSMGTEGRIKLPPVTHNEVVVELPPDVKRVYRTMKDTLLADLREFFDGEVHSASSAAVLSSKLSQIAAGFMYVDDADIRDGKYDVLHREKVKAVQEIVEGTGSPVLVFYRFKAELALLREALDGARLVTENGVIDEWNRGQVPIMLAHPASAGHGLNLQSGGYTAVWTSLPDWNLELWNQANKRLARQGQEHPVVIHRITAKGTIDSRMHDVLTGKAQVENALLDHLESLL